MSSRAVKSCQNFVYQMPYKENSLRGTKYLYHARQFNLFGQNPLRYHKYAFCGVCRRNTSFFFFFLYVGLFVGRGFFFFGRIRNTLKRIKLKKITKNKEKEVKDVNLYYVFCFDGLFLFLAKFDVNEESWLVFRPRDDEMNYVAKRNSKNKKEKEIIIITT